MIVNELPTLGVKGRRRVDERHGQRAVERDAAVTTS